MKLRGVILLFLLAGCKKGDGVVVVSVDAVPTISNVHSLSVHAQVGENNRDYTIGSLGGVMIPPRRVFAIQASADLGDSMVVGVQARDDQGQPVGPLAEGSAPLRGGESTSIDLVIGISALDGGADGAPDMPPIVAVYGLDTRPANPTCTAPR